VKFAKEHLRKSTVVLGKQSPEKSIGIADRVPEIVFVPIINSMWTATKG
jgi:hypothetical protein